MDKGDVKSKEETSHDHDGSAVTAENNDTKVKTENLTVETDNNETLTENDEYSKGFSEEDKEPGEIDPSELLNMAPGGETEEGRSDEMMPSDITKGEEMEDLENTGDDSMGDSNDSKNASIRGKRKSEAGYDVKQEPEEEMEDCDDLNGSFSSYAGASESQVFQESAAERMALEGDEDMAGEGEKNEDENFESVDGSVQVKTEPDDTKAEGEDGGDQQEEEGDSAMKKKLRTRQKRKIVVEDDSEESGEEKKKKRKRRKKKGGKPAFLLFILILNSFH